MKCRAKVFYKGKPRRKQIVSYLSPQWDKAPSNATICDGTIKVDIRATEEPEWGGTFPILEIEYRCDKCKNTIFFELPDKYSISEFVQNVIANLPEEPRKRWQASVLPQNIGGEN